MFTSINFLPQIRITVGLQPIPAAIGQEVGYGPWTHCQSIGELTQRDKQPFPLTFTPMANKNVFRLWKEAGERIHADMGGTQTACGFEPRTLVTCEETVLTTVLL